MVSNYLVRQATMAVIPGARAEGPEAAPHLAYPQAALKKIAPLNQRIEELRWEDVRRFANVTPEAFHTRMERYRKSPHGDVRWSYLLRTYAYDTFHGRVALALRSDYDPDLLFLHFQ